MLGKKHYLSFLTVAISAALTGCFDSSSSSGSNDETSPLPEQDISTPAPAPDGTLTGSFVDSPVGQLSYTTASGDGMTNAEGEFQYRKGEVVTFQIGDIVIGRTLGGDVLTPLDLVNEGSHPDKASNILRLLQSVDSDADPSNGISIDEMVRTLATNTVAEDDQLNFDTDSASFESNVSVQAMLGEVGRGSLVTEEQAMSHFKSTLEVLEDNLVDMRGTWRIERTFNGCPGAKAVATRTYTEESFSEVGYELHASADPDGMVSCATTPINVTVSYENLPADLCGPVCTLSELNRTIGDWEAHDSGYSRVSYKHRKGSDSIHRYKTDYWHAEDGPGYDSRGTFSSVQTRLEATNYSLDMRGTWLETTTNSWCPTLAGKLTLTYTDTGIQYSGEELKTESHNDATGSFSHKTCTLTPASGFITYKESSSQFCGPNCTNDQLNDVFTEADGDVVILRHEQGSNLISRQEGRWFTYTVKQ